MAFQKLQEVSNNFKNELHKLSSALFIAQTGETFEDALAKKMRDKALLSSKLKLLRAKALALTPHITEQPHDNALDEYGEKVAWKVLEQITVKSLTQVHAVKTLITTPNASLDPDLIKRKVAIINSLWQYHQKEQHLQNLKTHLKEKEAECAALKAELDRSIGVLRDVKQQTAVNEPEDRGPLYMKLRIIVGKLEVMRQIVGQLVCARGSYDWLAEPQRISVGTLALTRSRNTVEMFLEED